MPNPTQQLVFRLALFFSLLFGLALAARATTVNISSTTIPDIQAGAGTYELRIWLDRAMVDSDGVTRAAGAVDSPNVFKRVVCSYGAGGVVCPTFALVSTTDARVGADAKYTAKLYRNNSPLFVYGGTSFFLPANLAPVTTWSQVWGAQRAAPNRVLDETYFTASQTRAEIQAAQASGTPATTARLGSVKIDVDAADAASPVVVGVNSPLLDDGLGVDASAWNSLCEAVAAIGSTAQVLDITTALPSGSSCTVPATLTLHPFKGGSVVLGSGHTVTVLSGSELWPVAQIFSGSGTVKFDGNYKPQAVYPEWWGASPSASAAVNTPALQKAVNAAGAGRTNGSGLWAYNRVLKLSGMYEINDKLDVYHLIGFDWVGQNKFNSGIRQTATNKQIINGQSVAYGDFRNLTFETSASQNTALVDLDFDGSQGDDLRSQQIHFDNFLLKGNGVGYIGIRVAKSGGGAQGDNVYLSHFTWSGFTQSALMIGDGADGTPTALAFNAIYLSVGPGDCQGNPRYCISVYGGSLLSDGVTMENQTLGTNGIPTQTGADYLIYGPGNVIDIRNARSESLRFIQGYGANLYNITMAPYGTSWYAAAGTLQSLSGTVAFPNQLVTGSLAGGDGKLYKVTSARTVFVSYADIDPPFSTSAIPDNSASWTVNEHAGRYVQVRYPNCFIVEGGTIASNTATTLTLTTPLPFAPADASPAQACGSHTQYQIVAAPPAWGGLPITAATGGSSTTIVKSGAGWTNNAFVGYRASVVGGKGLYQYGLVTANTSDTITVAAGWVTDYELEFLPSSFAVVAPDNTSQFVVEPDWGTQTSDGVIEWEPFEYNVVDGNPAIGNVFLGSINGFRNSQGGRMRLGTNDVKNVVVSRADAFTGGSLNFDGASIPSGMEQNYVSRVVNSSVFGIPLLVKRNTGNQKLGPGVTQRTQGTEWIMWQAGQYGGGQNYPDVGMGRGDDQFANTNTNKDILAFEGVLGKRTARGTNQAGADAKIQGGLSTGSGAGGSILLRTAPAGSSGSTPNSPVTRITIDQLGNFLLAPVLFADLGAPSDGAIRFCGDCTAGSSPATGAGSGAFVFRQGGAWRAL